MNINYRIIINFGVLKPLIVSGCLLASITSTFSQTMPLPDPSVHELLLQQERNRELQERIETTPNSRLDDGSGQFVSGQMIPSGESPCFNIEEIVFVGDRSEKFHWAINAANKGPNGIKDQATNRCLGSQGLNIVLARIQNSIVEKGFITTRIFAAQQDLNDGKLILTVIPGYIRSIRWGETSQKRTSWRSALPMREGDILNLRELEQALEVFKRIPTADVDIRIEPGNKVGESDLVIYWQQKFPFRVNLSIDDGGSHQTGRYQSAVTVSYDNWLTLNDLFYISFNRHLASSQGGGSDGHSIFYSVPFKGNWLLSLSANSYNYDQNIAGINQTYTYSGSSRNFDATLSRLVFRDATKRANFYGKGWFRRSSNFIDDIEIEVQKRRTAGWEVGVDYRQFIGNAIFNADLSFRRGTGMNNAIRALEEKTHDGTSRMKLLRFNASLNAPWAINNQRFRYYGVFRGQWNYTPLIPQDMFAIGNRYTVRGFDGSNNLMGDRGWSIRNEVGWVIPHTAQELYVGLDHGYVSGKSVRYQLGQNLTGMVIGLRGWIYKASFDVFVGTPLHKPNHFQTSEFTSGFNLNISL